MKDRAIFNLYPNIVSITETSDNVFVCKDKNSKIVEISDWKAVDKKVIEMQQEAEANKQAQIDLKASAKAKLIAGEKLTEEEADILIGV